ncbi:MAG TPA: hypothetical protein VGD71_26775 [Kribbella sp.]
MHQFAGDRIVADPLRRDPVGAVEVSDRGGVPRAFGLPVGTP